MTRFFPLLVVLFYICGCNNDKSSSPFGEILSKPPFAPLTDSIEREPNRDELYFRRAILLNKADLTEPALADFKKAWDLKKEEKYAFGVSTILLDKNPDSAILFLDTAIRQLPQSVLLGLGLARALSTSGKTDQALAICNNLLESNPEQVDVLKMKASLLDKKERGEEAVLTLEKAYRLTPFDVELNYILALKYAEMKNPKVILLCDSLIKADSLGLHAEPYYYKGIYFSNLKDKSRALELFDDAIQHDYYFLDAHIEKGIVFYEQRKFIEAYKAFNLAMTISPKYADAYYWMGKSQQALGQKTEARINYQRAYGLDKSLTQAKDSADKLAK
ncbi:MAG TPA: tetratricopeptide repeat protein [Chitinophagaceae bacterium]|nr:tetratricopeptide repeat protein [Chitinophagaceae bacterium]